MPRYELMLLVDNAPGVVSRVAGLLFRRRVRVESFTALTTDNSSWFRITVVIAIEEQFLNRVVRQLHRLIDVVEVTVLESARLPA